MGLWDAILVGFSTALSWSNLSYCFIGVFVGTAVGVLPGLGPVATIFFGWLLLNEDVSIQQMLGAALVLSGVILVARKRAPAAVPEPAPAVRPAPAGE